MPPQTPQEAYETLEATYKTTNPLSHNHHQTALSHLPGGNTRTVLHYPPFPLHILSASASHLTSADGNTYTDFLNEYTAALYGHSHPELLSTITKTALNGLSYGSTHPDEQLLAAQIKLRFPSIDLLRFTNSGTEATLLALAASKISTGGRSKILCFAGAYHGGTFNFKGYESSPLNVPHEWLITTYNDLSSVDAFVRNTAHRDDIAAIIIEPMLGSGGAIPADLEFLKGLRKAANEVGAVLIYDEVMTSRMYSGGGIQSQLPLEMRPDLTLLGKYIGGGMSFGAFGGSEKIMSLFDPRKSNALAHAGTFNNNVLTMAAGRVGLEQIFTPERAQELHDTGEKLRETLSEIGRGTLLKVTGRGSIMCFHFTCAPAEQIKCHKDLLDENSVLGGLLHLFLLERGYYIARRGFVSLSLVLSHGELDGFAKAIEAFVGEYRHLLSQSENMAKL
ncbi:aminotransferase class III-fold pyridoxal phosphate-dependent enzyme [Lecanosticta acicola]|uniref:Aminotransferase class III-fold pyridoxal phosphate-dependent enzyme n=1 Tax=Lecanosticta acicola TaxID=111012 RepID=A0AAI8YXW3_9PEZI|nr:aminotransferase class III-fold pyridoxal phosphate-dependent enzyme [Lecanosticta acicola]